MRRQGKQLTFLHLENREFTQHPVLNEDFSKSRYLEKILRLLCGEVIYGTKPSYEDPARYSFAHGGKDATPYPVDRTTYDQTIATLAEAVRHSHMNPTDKDKALVRLAGWQQA
jgi:hypothetical protein